MRPDAHQLMVRLEHAHDSALAETCAAVDAFLEIPTVEFDLEIVETHKDNVLVLCWKIGEQYRKILSLAKEGTA